MKPSVLILLMFVAYASANCGCLKCSKHLQSVDILGSNGCPIKVVFKKPQTQCGSSTTSYYTPVIQVPTVQTTSTSSTPGKSYNYKVQYYSKPSYEVVEDCGGQAYSAAIQVPQATASKASVPLLTNLKYRTDTVLVPTPNCAVVNPAADIITWLNNLQTASSSSSSSGSTYASSSTVSGPTFERLSCCECNDRLEHVPNLVKNTPCQCARSKRDVNDKYRVKNDKTRHKRDLAKHSYNFLMGMLPQYVREPLHHSIQGVNSVKNEPKADFRAKLNELKLKLVGQPKELPASKYDLYHHKLDFPTPFGKKAKYSPHPIKSTLSPTFFDKEAALNSKKSFALKQDSQNTLFGIPKLADRVPESGADEKVLLKKLKKLNNNPFSSNIDDQANDFMQKVLQPTHTRTKRASDDELSRKKRTIVLSSQEIDLPAHYQVEFVSVEDESPERLEESEEDAPIVGNNRFLKRFPTFPAMPRWQPKTDAVIGKNAIQKAVREELEAYHKKVEKEQKIKDFKSNLQKKQQQASIVPHNPIFMLLTAPMKFLRHFHELNKGVNPVMTSLPKLVYTTKKYFRDFGKNFHKNCLNLASDLIGDFDHIQPNVVQELSNHNGRRFRRDIGNTEDCTPNNALAFKDSREETQNFHKVEDDHVRKKRYVIKVVDDREIQDQVQEYLSQKMDDQFSYLKPLQEYYDKVNEFITNLYANNNHLLQQPHTDPFTSAASFEASIEVKPKKKKFQIKKVKPRVIIDNKGLPFMEYDGYKRPLLLNKHLLKKTSPEKYASSEETGNKIATLIARAKEDSEVVGSAHKEIIPQQIVKERISSLLEEIDQLVNLNAEDYDEICEDLLRVQHIKTSIEQDWKRLLIDNKVDDIEAKITLLSKFKDLQLAKDKTVKNIANALEKNDNEFVRRQLMHSLVRLQKLQCLITSVVEDFEQNLNMKTSFNTKKEIKYVDFLSELKFVYAKTRNDLVKLLCDDRDLEGQKNIELLHKLKKLLVSAEQDPDKLERVGKLIWELKNLEKMQMQTIKETNKKLARNFKIKKELKILFDLQKRFEDCETELNELLGNVVVKATAKGGQKDVKGIIAGIKRKHEEMLMKAKKRAGGLNKLKTG